MPNLKARIISAAALVPPLVALVFLAPPWLFSVVIILVAAFSGFEFGAIAFGGSFVGYRLLLAFFSSVCAASVSLWHLLPWMPLGAFAFISIFSPAALMFFRADFAVSVRVSSLLCAGSVYTGGLLGFIALIFSAFDNGSSWVFTLFAGAFIGDTCSYAAGRAFGKHKLAPSLSPGKTWEGSVGGFFGTLLAVYFSNLFLLKALGWSEVLSLSFLLSVFCQVGDLAESFFKRGFGVKDSGKIIPGHGGVLDRIDALMFGAPILFLFISLKAG
jgi:phosphatidate cytidylyltransferase